MPTKPKAKNKAADTIGQKAGSARKNKRSPNLPTVAVIGYGSQGRAIALNLRDSGADVVVGLRSRSKSRNTARKDGLPAIMSLSDSVASASVVCMAFPDHLHGRVYRKHIEPFLATGSALWFLHGSSIHFGFVDPPADCDVILIAPHAPGAAVRDEYTGSRRVSAFYAIHQNKSGTARGRINSLASAIGIKPANLIESSFEHEAIGDLFGEQVVLCGGLAALIKNGFEVLVENGLKPDHAYLEVAYQLDLIIALIKQHGISGMFSRISVAARYGSLLAGPKVIDARTKAEMQKVYREIESGRFPAKLNRLEEKDIKRIDRALKELTDARLEKAARKFAP